MTGKKRTWDESFEALKQYKAKHGNTLVPIHTHYEDPALGGWVHHQRSKKDKLTDDQRAKLDSIGFAWSLRIRNKQWNDMMERLETFKSIHHGSCNVPEIYPADQRLADFFKEQRDKYSKGLLSGARIKQMEAAGFILNDDDDDDNDDDERNVEDPQNPAEEDEEETIEYDDKFKQNYQKLVDYHIKFGHCRVPLFSRRGDSLGLWVSALRRKYADNPEMGISPECQDLLNELNFDWQAGNDDSYKSNDTSSSSSDGDEEDDDEEVDAEDGSNNGSSSSDNDDSDTSSDDDEGSVKAENSDSESSLSTSSSSSSDSDSDTDDDNSVNDQSQMNGTKKRKIADSDSGGNPKKLQRKTSQEANNSRDARFHHHYQSLLAFRKKFGHCRVPQSAEYKTLGGWVNNLRVVHKQNPKCGIRPDRLKLLNDAGFIWDASGDRPTNDARWERQFELLEDFRREFGHCRAPQTGPHRKLGRWVATQRSLFAKDPENGIREDRLRRLNDIGFTWNAKEFKGKHFYSGLYPAVPKQAKRKTSSSTAAKLDDADSSATESDDEILAAAIPDDGGMPFANETGDSKVQTTLKDTQPQTISSCAESADKKPASNHRDHPHANHRLATASGRSLPMTSRPQAISSNGVANVQPGSPPSRIMKNNGKVKRQSSSSVNHLQANSINGSAKLKPAPTMGRLKAPTEAYKVDQSCYFLSKTPAEAPTEAEMEDPKGYYNQTGEGWYSYFAWLEDFHRQRGHARVTNGPVFDKLRAWMDGQKYFYTHYPADEGVRKERLQRLKEVGFLWGVQDDDQTDSEDGDGDDNISSADAAVDDWDAKYKELVKFRESNGHTRVQHYRANKDLARFVKRQQSNKGLLPLDRLNLLNDIGFEWEKPDPREQNLNDVRWDHLYGQLVEFQRKFGHTVVPQNGENKKLGKWVCTQRLSYNKDPKNGLRPDRLKRLNDIGFTWNAKEFRSRRFSASSSTKSVECTTNAGNTTGAKNLSTNGGGDGVLASVDDDCGSGPATQNNSKRIESLVSKLCELLDQDSSDGKQEYIDEYKETLEGMIRETEVRLIKRKASKIMPVAEPATPREKRTSELGTPREGSTRIPASGKDGGSGQADGLLLLAQLTDQHANDIISKEEPVDAPPARPITMSSLSDVPVKREAEDGFQNENCY